MFWQEEKNESGRFVVPDDVVDVAFNIVCRSLPVDHAYALSQAIIQALPWFAEESGAGLHPIHVADSGNGWMRPENPSDLLYLSKRTKLVLRLPHARAQDAKALSGRLKMKLVIGYAVAPLAVVILPPLEGRFV